MHRLTYVHLDLLRTQYSLSDTTLPNSLDQTVILCCRMFASFCCCQEYSVALFHQYVIDGGRNVDSVLHLGLR